MSKNTKPLLGSRNAQSRTKPTDSGAKTMTKPLKVVKSTAAIKPTTQGPDKLKKTLPKDEEKKPTKPTIKATTKTNINLSRTRKTDPKVQAIKIKPKTETRSQPLRAKHTPELLSKLKTNAATARPLSKGNVMTTVHNVTVASPPPKRKEIVSERQNSISEEIEDRPNRIRTRTRTLDPDEVIVLKNESSNGPKSLDTFFKGSKQVEDEISSPASSNIKVKGAVAFEINFDDTKKIMHQAKEEQKLKLDSDESENGDYEDDFESYESDFETGSSSAEQSEVESPMEESNEEPEEQEEGSSESDEESEETLPQITVIHRDKEDERKLDSGNYDLNLKRILQTQQFDSIDTSMPNSEQLDSGISYSGAHPVQQTNVVQFPLFKSKSISKRGRDLMRKLQLDTVSFTLFELKPINYEIYMKIYGNFNSMQAITQTNDNRMDTDCQTDDCQIRSVWTQHPPQYDLKFVQENNFINLRNACGEFLEEDIESESKENDPLAQSIRDLNKFKKNELRRTYEIRKQIDFGRLNEFLTKSTRSVTGILNTNIKSRRLQPSDLVISNGSYNLNTNFLNALRVVRIFSNSKFNMVLAIHESIDDVYKSDFLNLISVWAISEIEKPIRLLSTWSEVCRAEICSDSSDIIVCGLRDGSVAMWDLRETYSFCSKLDGCLTHFAATQSIAPTITGEDLHLTDLGAVVDVKSFKMGAKIYNFKTYKPIQFASLNDTGILTIWTLIETGKSDFSPGSKFDPKSRRSKIEYNSPWARVKLIQSAICDLREYLELKNIKMQSKFDKTRSYFENDIFSDDVLKELQETQQDLKRGLQGLRFTNLDTGTERIFVGTNRNFIISCSKTLNSSRFQKIFIDESKFLFPTAIRLLASEDFLVVGLSNGSVIALNCNQNKPSNKPEDDTKRPPSSSPAPTVEVDLKVGNSCAIQNIIRNERKSVDQLKHTRVYDSRQSLGSEFIADKHFEELPFEIFDQQVLLSGTVLRKNLVQSIELSSDGRRLFALTDGDVRVFDFWIGKELTCSTNRNIRAIGVAKEAVELQNLVLLTSNEEVQVHILK